jgi:hypothetical protein
MLLKGWAIVNTEPFLPFSAEVDANPTLCRMSLLPKIGDGRCGDNQASVPPYL